METIKSKLAAYEKACEECDAAEAAWVNDPENEGREREFDRTYSRQWRAMWGLIDAVSDLAEGHLTREECRALVISKCDELAELISRVA